MKNNFGVRYTDAEREGLTKEFMALKAQGMTGEAASTKMGKRGAMSSLIAWSKGYKSQRHQRSKIKLQAHNRKHRVVDLNIIPNHSEVPIPQSIEVMIFKGTPQSVSATLKQMMGE